MAPNNSDKKSSIGGDSDGTKTDEDTFHECCDAHSLRDRESNFTRAKEQEEEDNNESEDAYRHRVYGTTDKHGDSTAAAVVTRGRRLSRQLSRRLSQEIQRRRSSVEEALPKTPSGWAMLLSSIAAATVGYEVHLQRTLTCPPLVFGQCDASVLDPIHRHLTRSKKDAILSRNIKPSLFVGTRSVLASTAAFAMGGPSSTEEHVRFRQLLTMSQDGATIALDWELPAPDEYAPGSVEERTNQILKGPITQPVVLILHGINNDSSFGYIRSLMRACTKRGWIAVGMNFRGCGGAPVTTPRGYTGAYTGDLRSVVHSISGRMGDDGSLFLVGNSLGANLVTKYLGEEGLSGTLPECVAGGISLGNPLHIHSGHIAFPWDRILGLGARKGILLNLHHFWPMRKSAQYQSAIRKALLAPTIAKFDAAMAPIFIRNDPYYPFSARIGYEGAEEYWADASSFNNVRHISVPLLKLTSQDDFLVYKGSLGKLMYPLSNPNVMVVKTKCGGHLGWRESPPDTGNIFGFGTSWADTATTDFIEAVLLARQQQDDGQAGSKAKFVTSPLRSKL